MRGTRLPCKLNDCDRGIIPAHAGNTQTGQPCTNVYLGSSPRMRGTRYLRAVNRRIDGIIPAHAGNTWRRCRAQSWEKDHPRACGEHPMSNPLPHRYVGSSPRMRGTRIRSSSSATTAGIIPAHAGNTSPAATPTTRSRDHPRACGEHTLSAVSALVLAGSSPRMRGTRSAVSRSSWQAGIIPAHAGNTKDEVLADCIVRDHPRACGEHFVVAELLGHESGIIPAQAGNTQHI